MKVLRKIIEINDKLCDGCGQCVPACEARLFACAIQAGPKGCIKLD